MKVLFPVLFLILVVSCASEDTEVKLLKEITSFEDSLRLHPSEFNAPKLKLVEKYIAFQSQFPKSEKAPEMLDKAHMVYSGVGLYRKSVQMGDRILKEYPKYINRAMILESQAVSYDLFLVPRDSTKVRYYYSILLKENPKLERTRKEEINFRLKNNHLTIDELIDLQANSAK